MKKYLLIATLAVFTTAGVTAAMLSSGEKKPAKKEAKKEVKAKKDCSSKKRCVFWN